MNESSEIDSYERMSALWKRFVTDTSFSALREHILNEIERNRIILEKEDSVDARAEIRFLRSILKNAEYYKEEK